MTQTPAPNHLKQESSPYLLQHADNPVDWYAWNEEALQKAREENKPILLSIGYSACHWCHVMAHESFEDPATAEVMNRLFINIKVDREERPDLDKIYQSAHQLLAQRAGGWPLTVFITPDDHTPFFAGTYFPKQPRHGMPAFVEVMQKVEAFYRDNQDDIRAQNSALLEAMQNLTPTSDRKVTINSIPLDEARQQLAHNYDATYGGFGQAPKFPHPTNLERLLRHWAATGASDRPDQAARDMCYVTLHAMASGGMYDQLGGGFFRYSVDEKWMIPHFEKMLYDNGPLLALYSQAWQTFGDQAFKRIATQTAEWVMREMQSPQGGYYSTLDADSEGKEGKFYVWSDGEVRQLLDNNEYNLLRQVFGFDQPPNFEGEWHLHNYLSVEHVAERLKLEKTSAAQAFEQAKQKLYQARQQRPLPGRDEKVLTAWNGLMIKGMAMAGHYLQRNDFIESAQQAVDFIRSTLFHDGRLLASWKDGKARLMAYLDDYAFLVDGLLELLQTQWRDEDVQFAIELCDALLAHFEDKQQGGFFFTDNAHEQLFHRPKPVMDEAIPSGNGIAALVLARMGHLIGNMDYINASERALHFAWPSIQQVPYANCALLSAVEEYLYPPQIIVVRAHADATSWYQACHQHYAPRRMSFVIPDNAKNLPGLLAERKPQQQSVAYVCEGSQCRPSINSLQQFTAYLNTATMA